MDSPLNVPRWTPTPSPTRTPPRDYLRVKDVVLMDPADSDSTSSYGEEEFPFSHSKPSFPFSNPPAAASTGVPNLLPPPPSPPLLNAIEAPSLRVNTQVKTQINQTSNVSPSYGKLQQSSVDVEPLHIEHPLKREEQVIRLNDQVRDGRYKSAGGGSPRSPRGWSPPPRTEISGLEHHHPPLSRAAGATQVVRFNDQLHDDGYRSAGGSSPRSPRGRSPPPGTEISGLEHRHPPPLRAAGATLEDFQQGWKKNGGGIYLTWKDLWVTVPDKKGGRRGILQGVTGYVEPGEVLAIMGPSGCGKSTLLDALAGRLGSNTRQTGEILVNGRKQTLSFGTSAYVTQDDTLMTTLTVKEAVYYSAQLQLPDSMSRSEKKERAEVTIREMGLQDAMNTRIGGWSSKGLSGGQKRRVSICIEVLTRPKLLFLDEPTSGLDSAASYHVMNRIIKLAQQDRRTVIASIHQPSAEVFELFHNLCLLSSGGTVYFGSTSMANEFFAINGFPCPPMRNPSDHYLRTVNKDFDVDIEQGFGGKTSTIETINVLVKSYKASEANQQVERRVQEICQQGGGALEKKGSQAGFITQCLVLTRRSFVNMYRDLGYYWLRLAIYIALCLCVGTIYYDIGHSYGSIQARGSMLMFVAAFLTFMAIGGFPSFVEDMKIFTRERLNGHYGVGAFVVGNTLSSVPYLLLISLIPGAMAYYLVGLQKGIDHFAYFAVMLFACMLLVESLMMIVASSVPDFLMGIITGAGIQGVMMLNGGFFRLPNDLPKPFWKYPMYYIAFHKYANQGFYKNEFEGLTFPNNVPGGPKLITGDEILRNIWQVQMGYSKWVDVGIVLGMVVLYRFMFLVIIKTVEKVKPMLRSLMAGSSKHPTYPLATPLH